MIGVVYVKHKFQSTLPVRGATVPYEQVKNLYNISIHAPREGSDTAQFIKLNYPAISIHAPREGSDKLDLEAALAVKISIHAPREGSDAWPWPILQGDNYFNPRSP